MSDSMQNLHIEQAAWSEGWRKSPLWLRLLGGPKQFYADRGSYRLKWGELSLKPCSVGLSIGGYETAHLHIALGVGQAFIHLPFLTKAICEGPNSIEQPHFGFAIHPTDIHLNWGRKCKIIYLPWQRRFIFNEFLDVNGEWRPRQYLAEEREGDVPHWTADLPYHYMLDDGEVQHVVATVTRQRHWPVWCWFGESTHPFARNRVKRPRNAWISDGLRRLQKRLRQPVDTLDIKFSEEVGSRRGSWKGGCIGCSYEMNPGETPKHTWRGCSKSAGSDDPPHPSHHGRSRREQGFEFLPGFVTGGRRCGSSVGLRLGRPLLSRRRLRGHDPHQSDFGICLLHRVRLGGRRPGVDPTAGH